MKSIKNRFWEKVDVRTPDDCWQWKASLSNKRYGNIKVSGKMVKSHRLSYELEFGDIPNGLNVLHKCDNGLCVNPKHLFLGTHNDNMKDCAKKGRVPNKKGTHNGNSKLNHNNIQDIRSNCVKGDRKYGLSSFARKYNVSAQTIWGIVHNNNWTHIPPPKKAE